MLPLDIIEEIIKTHPVKSLIQYRSVSKAWKSLIDSSRFIASHCRHVQHLRAMYYVGSSAVIPRHFSIVDDSSSPQQIVPVTAPLLVNVFRHHFVIVSSHGLLCLYGIYCRSDDFPFPGKRMVVIWNVPIKKAIAVMENDDEDKRYTTVIGFGVCRETNDPKIVKIKHIYPQIQMERGACVPWEVEVFALSTGAWRSSYNNPPRNTIEFSDTLYDAQVVVDGSIYWLATNTVKSYREKKTSNLIIAFDITSEEFREIKHPGGLAHHCSRDLSICKLRESLVVLERHEEGNNLVFNAWMMENGVTNSFTKLVTFSFTEPDVRMKEFKTTVKL
ncbi:F-box/kelch-repeat protein At3g23880-like [Bidens hawaiensis]|uniref:F-box/kelch-repeat protein At3g23880-like n=1 Tax=Bidens hawaiensis TaxID=980011 RepID=UPI0040492CB6